MIRRLCAVLVMLVCGIVLAAPAVSAHPLGNFTTNTSAALLAGPEAIDVVYVLDLAEIPTQQTRRDIADAGGPDTWAQEECRTIAGQQALALDDITLPMVAEQSGITFPEGEAGLDTLRLSCLLRAETGALDGPVDVAFEDTYESGRLGWREVVAVGDGTTLTDSDVPATSSTDQLRDYPDAEVVRVTTATLTVDPAGGDPAPSSLRDADLSPLPEPALGIERIAAAYTALVARQDLTIPFVLLAIVLAAVLGTAHAVAPGHGKTVIAAYLLGEGGQARQATALGVTVAITHTVGVLALGVVVQTSTTLAPESLYPVLGVMGGVLFTLLGVYLLTRAIRRRGGHSHGGGHSHDHGHDHGHGTSPPPTACALPGRQAGEVHTHGHVHGHPVTTEDGALSWRMLVLPGLAGGMVPSPSALLVLLGGIALDRTWFGIVLVLFYGVGMAGALVGAGYLLHRVRFRLIDKLEGRTWARISGVLPVATSSLIVVGGVVIVARSLLVV